MITNPVVASLSLNRSVVAIPNKISAKLTTYDDFINQKMKEETHYMNYSEHCLIALTEAPTQNIKSWSARKYEQNGINVSILKMISTGYHDPEVWKSIIFQLHQAVYILHKKNICIWNFNLENNVYIKDTNYDNNNIGYWKYKINGIEFFVPNYGSILLIDTNFKDLDVGGTVINNVVACKNDGRLEEKVFRHKIMMQEFFDEELKTTIEEQNKDVFKNKIFSENEFKSKTDDIYGGIPPPQDIIDIIKNIGSLPNNYENIILNHGYFLHNRVGTLLTEEEKKKIVLTNPNYNKGDLIAFTEDGSNYYFGIYYDKFISTSTPIENKHKIIKISRDTNNKYNRTEILDVDAGMINFVNDKIKQTYKTNMRLAEEDLIETYEINF